MRHCLYLLEEPDPHQCSGGGSHKRPLPGSDSEEEAMAPVGEIYLHLLEEPDPTLC